MFESNPMLKEQIIRDAKKLAEDVGRLAENKTEEVKEEMWKKADMARQKWDESKVIVREKFKEMDRFTHEKPWTAVGIAAGVVAVAGLIIGALAEKSKKRY